MATATGSATGGAAAGGKSREDSVVTEQCVRDLLEFFATRSSGYRARHVDRRVSHILELILENLQFCHYSAV